MLYCTPGPLGGFLEELDVLLSNIPEDALRLYFQVTYLIFLSLLHILSLSAATSLSPIQPLQLIKNAATQLVFNLPKFSHTTLLLCSLHWLPVAAQIWFQTLALAYRAVNPGHGQTIHCYSLTVRVAQLPLNKITAVCCPGSTAMEQAPH